MAEPETAAGADLPTIAYCNGELMPAAAARLPIDDAGVLYGLGFFETFLTSGGHPHHWSFHRERLAQACGVAGITVPGTFLARDEARLRGVAQTLLRENKMSDAVFRYTLTAGRVSLGGRSGNFDGPAEFMTLRVFPPAAPAEGISLRVLRLARDNGEWLPRPKSLNYSNALAGAGELRRRAAAASDEGLFLSRDERCVVETVRQNIAWIEGGKLCYPDETLGPVAGTCLQWALSLGIPSAPRRIKLGELAAADAVVVLNAVRGVTPVRELWDDEDRQCLARVASCEHPMVLQLRESWRGALQATVRSGSTG
jgi:4-amino-4-deoxychorismate lyase